MLFERYVAASKPSPRRRSLLVAVVLLHALAALALSVVGWVHVEELAPPGIRITFVSAPPPPPPPPASAARSSARPRHVERHARTLRQPLAPRLAQPQSEPETKTETSTTRDDGEHDADGSAAGVPGGVVGGVPSSAPAPPPPPRMVPSQLFDRDRLAAPDPRVPETFRRRHAGETVHGLYRICVRTDGHVSEVTPLSSIAGLDDALVAHVKATWLYKPQPSPVCTPRLFTFQID